MDEQKAPKKKKHWFLRLLAFLITLALCAGAIFLIANRDMLNLDAWKRYIAYRSLERNDSGQAESFSYSGSSTDVFAAVGDDLLVCSEGGIRLYSGSGVCYVEELVILENPAVDVCGNMAAVYSVGGNVVYLYRDRTQWDVLSDLDGALLSVQFNSSGWLAVTSRESGYKAVVTIYDDELNKLMAFRLNDIFATDAVVTEDCKSLAVVSIGQDGTTFESTLSFYDLLTGQDSGVYYEQTPATEFSLGNNVITELHINDSIWCVGDSGVSVWDGNSVGSWSCQGQFLKGYSFSENFTAMLVGKYRAGNQAELYTVDRKGSPSVARVITDQVLSLSAAGRYVAVLTVDQLDIYTQDLDLYARLEGTDGARKVLLREDGTALLVGNGTAHLYVPD